MMDSKFTNTVCEPKTGFFPEPKPDEENFLTRVIQSEQPGVKLNKLDKTRTTVASIQNLEICQGTQFFAKNFFQGFIKSNFLNLLENQKIANFESKSEKICEKSFN